VAHGQVSGSEGADATSRSSTWLCNAGDIPSVTCANDAAACCSYAPAMTDRTRREPTMKRIAIIGAVIAAFAIAPTSALAGHAPAAKPRITAEVVIGVQVTSVQRARAEFTLQTYRAQLVQAQRWTKL